jgi:hypothetical protein
VGALGARQDHVLGVESNSNGRWYAHLNALISHKLPTGSSVFSPTPVSPEQWCGTNDERMEQHTHLARLFGRSALPLTLLTERTGAATVNTGSIHNTQASVGFSALLMRGQFLVSWAAKRSIRLESKILGSEATSLPCGTHALRGKVVILPSQKGTFLSLLAMG